MSMNVIILREQIKMVGEKNILISLIKKRSKVDPEENKDGEEGQENEENNKDYGKVNGVKWMSDTSENRIEIDTKDILG